MWQEKKKKKRKNKICPLSFYLYCILSRNKKKRMSQVMSHSRSWYVTVGWFIFIDQHCGLFCFFYFYFFLMARSNCCRPLPPPLTLCVIIMGRWMSIRHQSHPPLWLMSNVGLCIPWMASTRARTFASRPFLERAGRPTPPTLYVPPGTRWFRWRRLQLYFQTMYHRDILIRAEHL